ncbi:GWT1-domain-containing protein [Guyanagaster necrorhizus]|uniref:GPI-anchored wall transfer protein n=1 Tax=Guyanagaster necrorhizus TaxID=856835 RepID=A0A9P7VYA1_9AGAR|nr:GWT1-domain-containing protein [Guyanagaster necrorhizus MCA 3950]KAG7448680.1 GWT1-domain-containing protein [Guyanagaster necrorhizus MCA 3950]
MKRDAGEYKELKENFVSGATGSTVTQVNLISCAALASVFLYHTILSRTSSTSLTKFPISWVILVLPLLLSMTLFANMPTLLSILMLVPALGLSFLPRRESGTPLPSNESERDPASATAIVAPLPYLTTYRAHMLLMTVLAILAVDFPLFPRSLAKCESFGVSLMDLGVGAFVFSQGVISAIPLIKSPAYLASPVLSKLATTIRKVFPILVLGIVRVLLVKGTEYPEHETEYGTHWNFFITLALLPVMEILLHPVILRVPISMLGILIAMCQQLGLSVFGLQNIVLFAPRAGFLSANKEGIVSLLGYLAVHLLGLSTGTLILPPSPSYFRRFQRQFNKTGELTLGGGEKYQDSYRLRQNDKIATELWAYSMLWWAFMGLTRLFQIDGKGGVSRRVVNLSYILWVAAYNTSFILAYLLMDLYFYPSPSKSNSPQPSGEEVLPSRVAVSAPLFEAVNKNGLLLFLLANVFTGLINLTIPTMFTSDFWAMVVLCEYSIGVCWAAWALRNIRVWRI